LKVDPAVWRVAFVVVSVWASHFSVQAGEKDQVKFIFLERSYGSFRNYLHRSSSGTSGPVGDQLRGRTCVPGFYLEDADRASRRGRRQHNIQSDTHIVQAAYHTKIEFLLTHSQGVVSHYVYRVYLILGRDCILHAIFSQPVICVHSA